MSGVKIDRDEWWSARTNRILRIDAMLRIEGESDTKAAIYENNEVYPFLESASRKYGIGFNSKVLCT
jgi:hypothetical protein